MAASATLVLARNPAALLTTVGNSVSRRSLTLVVTTRGSIVTMPIEAYRGATPRYPATPPATAPMAARVMTSG